MKTKNSIMLAAMATAALVISSASAQEVKDTPAKKASATTAPVEVAAPKKLEIGSTVPALKGITWLQGDPVQKFDEKGKVYMLELWATWCGPCVAIIPHVNDLHKKYADKGLVVIGMNVWEDDINKPTEFLKKQGDAMSYRVAFSGGKGADFASSWLTPAGIQGIPHAILIKDGKIIFTGHPSGIENETIEQMLSSTFDPAAYAKEQEEKAKAQEAFRAKVMPLFQKKDWDGLIALADTLEDGNPDKNILKTTAIIEKADWKALAALQASLKGTEDAAESMNSISGNAVFNMATGEASKEFAVQALTTLKPIDPEASIIEQFQDKLVAARLNFLAGNSDAAKTIVESLEPMVEKIDNPRAKAAFGKIPAAAAKALAEGKFPAVRTLLGR